eukprot:350255-Chlamydomonas_euryale.AAC.26
MSSRCLLKIPACASRKSCVCSKQQAKSMDESHATHSDDSDNCGDAKMQSRAALLASPAQSGWPSPNLTQLCHCSGDRLVPPKGHRAAGLPGTPCVDIARHVPRPPSAAARYIHVSLPYSRLILSRGSGRNGGWGLSRQGGLAGCGPLSALRFSSPPL